LHEGKSHSRTLDTERIIRLEHTIVPGIGHAQIIDDYFSSKYVREDGNT